MKMRVLIAAEDAALRARLAEMVQALGYAVALAGKDPHAPPDARGLTAAVVAPASGGEAGVALARTLCSGGCRVIVIAEERDALPALSRLLPEADAFLAPPLNEQTLAPLLARIAAPQTGEAAGPARILRFEGRTLDLAGHTLVDEHGREVALTRAELGLLTLLARCSGRALTRDQLRNGISGRDHDPYDRSIDMLVARLRTRRAPISGPATTARPARSLRRCSPWRTKKAPRRGGPSA